MVDWANIYLNQKKFLYHKSEENQSFYCGRTCFNWFQITVFFAVFYLGTAALVAASYYIFVAAVITPGGNLPHRRAFKYANDKINHTDLVRLRDAVDKAMNNHLMISSHLDFPVLSHVPRRYSKSGGKSDDNDPGNKRVLEYLHQVNAFRHRAAASHDKGTEECGDGDFAFVDKLKEDVRGKHCKVNKKELDLLGAIGGDNFWLNSNNSFTAKVVVKLNKIIGFIPQPPTEEEFKTQVDHTKTYSNYKKYDGVVPVEPKLQPGLLPVFCWYFGYDDKKGETNNLPKMDGLIKLAKGGIPLKHFPFAGQKDYSAGFDVMTVDFKSQAKVEEVLNKVIVVHCRAIATNIPYQYKIDIRPITKFGHFRLNLKVYKDDNDGGKFYLKLEGY